MNFKFKEEDYDLLAKIMKVLSHPVRLKIVKELKEEKCLCELQPLFSLDKSTLSRHIAELKRMKIVNERKDGRRIFLKLNTICLLNIFECIINLIEKEEKNDKR